MRTALKRALLIVAAVALAGFLTFLYYIPPFLTVAPETFSTPVREAAPAVTDIADPAERVIAERGRTIVMRSGCIGCHATNGPRGPIYSKYLAGGGIRIQTRTGSFVSRNLTPDPKTGLARRSDQEVMRTITSGVFPDGHVVSYTVMPWGAFSNLTVEDRRAVVSYLRHLPPVYHQIPDPDNRTTTAPGAIEQDYGGRDYGLAPAVQ